MWRSLRRIPARHHTSRPSHRPQKKKKRRDQALGQGPVESPCKSRLPRTFGSPSPQPDGPIGHASPPGTSASEPSVASCRLLYPCFTHPVPCRSGSPLVFPLSGPYARRLSPVRLGAAADRQRRADRPGSIPGVRRLTEMKASRRHFEVAAAGLAGVIRQLENLENAIHQSAWLPSKRTCQWTGANCGPRFSHLGGTCQTQSSVQRRWWCRGVTASRGWAAVACSAEIASSADSKPHVRKGA